MSSGNRKKFYNSKLWKKIRLNIWRKQHLLCAICGLPVYVDKLSDYIPKENRRRGIVHHKEHLTEQNVFDDNISIDESNLIGVCLECHNNKCHNQSTSTRGGLLFDEEGNLIKQGDNERNTSKIFTYYEE